jgi:hypothetical protein
MKARAKWVAAAALVAALLTTGFWAAMFAGPSSASSASSSLPTVPTRSTGSFTMTYSQVGSTCESKVNPSLPACWTCHYPVDLDQVDITVDPTSATQPNANTEAVRLGAGCTGRIGKITVHTKGGDGIKVLKGAANLVVGGGSVTCQTPPAGLSTDQYGIRVWGGNRVTFAGMYVNCQTSNSRVEYFMNQVPAVNAGGLPADRPTDVLLAQSCLASGPITTARIGGSEWGSALTSVLYPFVPGPGHGLTSLDIDMAPSGNNPPTTNFLDFANTYPGSQSSCLNTAG